MIETLESRVKSVSSDGPRHWWARNSIRAFEFQKSCYYMQIIICKCSVNSSRRSRARRAFIRIRYNERRAIARSRARARAPLRTKCEIFIFRKWRSRLARAGPVGDRFTLNGGQTRHVARHGVSRSKAPTSPSSLHDVLYRSSPVCTLYLVPRHRTRGLILGRALFMLAVF